MEWIKFYLVNLVAVAICHMLGLEKTFHAGYILGVILIASANIFLQ